MEMDNDFLLPTMSQQATNSQQVRAIPDEILLSQYLQENLKRVQQVLNQKDFSENFQQEQDHIFLDDLATEPLHSCLLPRPIAPFLLNSHNSPKSDTSSSSQRKLPDGGEQLLPEYFKPGPYSVIIGRGRDGRDAIGNRRLRVIASRYLQKYAKSPDRTSKSRIVATIVSIIREASPVGAFVRTKPDGRWYEVKESVATEKVGYTMRELLGDQYRSSSKSKALRRQSGGKRKEANRSMISKSR